jgi:hypothetical protein
MQSMFNRTCGHPTKGPFFRRHKLILVTINGAIIPNRNEMYLLSHLLEYGLCYFGNVANASSRQPARPTFESFTFTS